MNKKVLSILLAVVIVAAIVPATVLPAVLPEVSAAYTTPRFLWNTTTISLAGENYTTELFMGHVINITIGSNTTTLNPDGTGNVVVINQSSIINNFNISFEILGDPTVIKIATATVSVFPGQTIPYVTSYNYTSYTNYVGKGIIKIKFRKPLNLSQVNNITTLVKIYFTNGQTLTRTIVIFFDHGKPVITPLTLTYNATGIDYNSSTGTYVNSTLVTKSLLGTNYVPYFETPFNVTVNFKDLFTKYSAGGVYKVGVMVIDVTDNNTPIAQTNIYINNSRYYLDITPTLQNISAGYGIPPSLNLRYLVNTSFKLVNFTVAGVQYNLLNTMLLYNAKYLMNRTELDMNDIFTEVLPVLGYPYPYEVLPVKVEGTDQDFNMTFHFAGPFKSNHVYEIIFCTKDIVGNKVTKTIFIGDSKKPTVVIGAPTPGSIYNSQGYNGIKFYAYIFDGPISSNITTITISMKDQFGNPVNLSEYIEYTSLGNNWSGFNWTIGEEVIGHVLHKLIAPQKVPTSQATPLYFTIEYLTHALPDGKYVINVTATDRAGNNGSATTYFIVDTIAPRITSVVINGHYKNTTTVSSRYITANVTGGYVSLSWNATDKVPGYPDVETSGIVAYYVTVTDENGNTIGTYTLAEPHIVLNLPVNRTYYVEIYAKDAANNPVDPAYVVNVKLKVLPGQGIASFVQFAKELNGTFIVSDTASADNYAVLMFAAPSTGPLPIRYAQDFTTKTLTNESYVITIGGPAVNPVTAEYQDIAPVKMYANNGVVTIETPVENFTWTAPKPWYNVTSGYFVIQMVKDEKTGAIIFMIYGTDRDSTAAGAYWLYNEFETGNIYKYSNVTWVVGKWTDTDHKVDFDFLKGAPDDNNGFSFNDSIQIVAEG